MASDAPDTLAGALSALHEMTEGRRGVLWDACELLGEADVHAKTLAAYTSTDPADAPATTWEDIGRVAVLRAEIAELRTECDRADTSLRRAISALEALRADAVPSRKEV